MTADRPSLKELLRKEPWIPALLAIGLILLLWPGKSNTKADASATGTELRLRDTLATMEGVGKVQVLLAEKESRDGGYTGAVIVCEGAVSSVVKLRLVQAVSVFTGLGTDKIIVEQWKSS